MENELAALRAQCARLIAVAVAADDYRMSNDVSDELHEALDNLLPEDVVLSSPAAATN